MWDVGVWLRCYAKCLLEILGIAKSQTPCSAAFICNNKYHPNPSTLSSVLGHCFRGGNFHGSVLDCEALSLCSCHPLSPVLFSGTRSCVLKWVLFLIPLLAYKSSEELELCHLCAFFFACFFKKMLLLVYLGER